MHLRLRFAATKIGFWAGRYDGPEEDELLASLSAVRAAGYLTKRDLTAIGEWKSPRIRAHIQSNDESLVREVTRIALSTTEERVRLHVLLALQGVGWPVASVILHLCHRDRYPILDVRALWSVSAVAPLRYSFDLWEAYTALCRRLATDSGVSMRVLDRALWAYAKEHQPTSRGATV